MSNHFPNNLSERHILGHAEGINTSDLRHHLIISHGVAPNTSRTKAQLGKVHLLAHAVQAHPELRELLGLSEMGGK
jgi:hypothetical protein